MAESNAAGGRQRAVAYIRESTGEQGQGFSPEAQREAIRRFTVENDLELTEEYSDVHSVGANQLTVQLSNDS